VMEGFSDFSGDLVDLVDVDDAALGALDVVVRHWRAGDDVLHILANVPASVSVVASAMVKERPRIFARVCASSVFPGRPVGR